MNDFDYEVLQKKRLARQSSHRKRGSKSKKCPTSTDHMTRKQWEERCGEIMTYELGKPMNWEQFRKMPANLQKEYLVGLVRDYSATASDLARMFGITPQTVTRFCGNPEISIEFSRGKRMPKDCRTEFEKFLSGPIACETDSPGPPPQESDVSDRQSCLCGLPRDMGMTEFSLCFEGIVNPEMVTNSIIAMLRPDASVKLEVRCSILP